jgi:hypothetical protein
MTQAIERYVTPATEATTVYEPQNASDAYQMAGRLVKSGLLPAGIQTAEAAFAIIVTGKELGLTVMQSLRSVHIIKGKPTLSADLILALVKRSAACQYFQLVKSTDKVATYRTLRVGEEPTEMSFTHEQAQRAGLMGNDNWKKYPEAMLRARCIAALARAVYPDVVLGVYETSELEAVPQERRSEPRPVAHTEDGVIEEASSEPDLSPELAASVAADKMAKAASVGELQEAFSDAYKLFGRLTPEQREKLTALKDARKAELKANADAAQ